MHSIAEREFARKPFAHAADMRLHGGALQSEFPGQLRNGRAGFPAVAEFIDGHQPLGPALLTAQFHYLSFLLLALGTGASHLPPADDAAGEVAHLLADLPDAFARDAVLTSENNVRDGLEFADEFFSARNGKFGRDAGVASSA